MYATIHTGVNSFYQNVYLDTKEVSQKRHTLVAHQFHVPLHLMRLCDPSHESRFFKKEDIKTGKPPLRLKSCEFFKIPYFQVVLRVFSNSKGFFKRSFKAYKIVNCTSLRSQSTLNIKNKIIFSKNQSWMAGVDPSRQSFFQRQRGESYGSVAVWVRGLFPWFWKLGQYSFRGLMTVIATGFVHCFDNGYVGKQPAAWKEHCAEYW